MEKTTLIQVTNRDSGQVGYTVPELGIRRQFMPKETKEITFEELLSLSYLPGGDQLIAQYLVIRNEDAVKELLHGVEPEYYYTEDDIKRVMVNGTLDEFLDMLDFAPAGVISLIKELAVSLPLDNMSKREAILEKTNFNVTRAIEIQNTKYDGDTEDAAAGGDTKPVRRAAVAAPAQPDTARRTSTPKYNVVNK